MGFCTILTETTGKAELSHAGSPRFGRSHYFLFSERGVSLYFSLPRPNLAYSQSVLTVLVVGLGYCTPHNVTGGSVGVLAHGVFDQVRRPQVSTTDGTAFFLLAQKIVLEDDELRRPRHYSFASCLHMLARGNYSFRYVVYRVSWVRTQRMKLHASVYRE
jgi:hypothetical protein